MNPGVRQGQLIIVSHKTASVLLIYSSPVKVLSVIEERQHLPSKHQKHRPVHAKTRVALSLIQCPVHVININVLLTFNTNTKQ